MNKYIKIALVCGALAACMLLSACGQFGGGREQIDNVLDKIYGTNGSETAAPEGSTEASKPEPVVRSDAPATSLYAIHHRGVMAIYSGAQGWRKPYDTERSRP